MRALRLTLLACSLSLGNALTVARNEREEASGLGFRYIPAEEGIPSALPWMPGSHRLHRQDHARNTKEVTTDGFDKDTLEVTSSVSAMQDPFRTGNSKLKLVGIETRMARGKQRRKITEWELPNTLGLDGLENAFAPGTGDWVEGGPAPQFRFHTKIVHINQWLQKQDPEDFVIYIDSDVVWGGCSEEQFMREFQAIAEASNASIITGAEFGCAAVDEPLRGFKCPVNRRDGFKDHNYHYIEKPAWAKKLYGDDQERWVRPGFVNVSCSNYAHGACSDPPQMIFLNSGFAAGKAKDLVELYKFMEQQYEGDMVYGKYANDMNVYNQYFYNGANPIRELRHRPKARLTLDYGNRLVTNLHAVNLRMKSLDGVSPYYTFEDKSPFQVMSNGNIKSKLTNELTCFLHFNGNQKDTHDHARRMTLAMRGMADPYIHKEDLPDF